MDTPMTREQLMEQLDNIETKTVEVRVKSRAWVLKHYSALREELEGLKQSRHDIIQAFIHGKDKLCLVCGAKEPCELKDDPSSPCTFDPTPMELHKECTRLRKELTQVKQELQVMTESKVRCWHSSVW